MGKLKDDLRYSKNQSKVNESAERLKEYREKEKEKHKKKLEMKRKKKPNGNDFYVLGCPNYLKNTHGSLAKYG